LIIVVVSGRLTRIHTCFNNLGLSLITEKVLYSSMTLSPFFYVVKKPVHI